MGIAVDPLGSGGLFVADTGNARIKLITNAASTSTILTYAGIGTIGSSGDGGLATSAEFAYPSSVTADTSGNVYICDQDNSRVRVVAAASGVRRISTIAGSRGSGGYGGDGGPATMALLSMPYSAAVDSSGNVYISDQANHRVRLVNRATGIITTVVGTGTAGSAGDGGAATAAQLDLPRGLALASNWDLYIVDHNNNRIRKRAYGTGVLTTVVGNGQAAYGGDGGLASVAALNKPCGVAVVGDTLYIADSASRRVRMVSGGVITTLAGTGVEGTSGDDGSPLAAMLSYPVAVAVDGLGVVYIADAYSVRRVVSVDQAATTVEAGPDLRYLAALAGIVPVIAIG
jgi:sugar lactone lactonase YvrE